ncbi:hypothetical protein Tco_1005213 [Tanacetum coccineum]|uniref:FRIGIDA-like protein n=1 Tax=Tanacetum coccineum TaxID=301880 RepID=A0ABQ5FFD6_9ASTR
MEISIADQIALDDALSLQLDHLRLGNVSRLSSDVTSKEANPQMVYDCVKAHSFLKAIQVTADAPRDLNARNSVLLLMFISNLSDLRLNNKKHIISLSSSQAQILWEAPNCPPRKKVWNKEEQKTTELVNIFEQRLDISRATQNNHKKEPSRNSQLSLPEFCDDDQDNAKLKMMRVGKMTLIETLLRMMKMMMTIDDMRQFKMNEEHERLMRQFKKTRRRVRTEIEMMSRRDTNTDLDGRDDVMTDVILPQVQATQEIEDTHVTLTLVNPDGQQQSSSVSSGFVSNMLNPNQDTGVDDIFGQHTEATSLIDTPVTAIMEPSFTAQINRPPTPYPLVIQTQQPPILTPATTTSSSLQNLPNFASLFGFDYRLKALEDNFSELRQTNQYAEALSSIPGIVDQYLANKMQEAVDVAVQLKYDRIREESTTANQQFLDSIDEGMKKIIKEQVKKEVSKITPKIEKLVTDQLESEVLVRSSKEANTSHAVAANLSELELKKILIDKMEANNSINRSDIQRQLYKALVDAYEADKILLDTYGDTVTIKRPRDGADDDQEPSAGTDRGSKRRRSGKEPASTSAPSETTTTTAGKTTTTGSKTHKKSASQSAPVEEAMQTTDVFEAPAHQEFETGVHDEQAEEEVQHLPDWFQQPTRPYFS